MEEKKKSMLSLAAPLCFENPFLGLRNVRNAFGGLRNGLENISTSPEMIGFSLKVLSPIKILGLRLGKSFRV